MDVLGICSLFLAIMLYFIWRNFRAKWRLGAMARDLSCEWESLEIVNSREAFGRKSPNQGNDWFLNRRTSL